MPMKKKARASAKPAKVPKHAKPAKRASPKQAAPMFQKIAFTMFSVQDAKRARAFYEDVLGLTRGLASPDGGWTEYDLPGGGCLALFRHPDPASARAPGGAGVALEVADLDALNRRLSAAGVVYQGGMIHGPHCRMSNILDSEGNAIILHELARKK
jgi:predicted enzyme related to lactoylglutathione lyase